MRLRLEALCTAKVETFEADTSHVICRRPDHCSAVSGGDRWDVEGIARKMGSQRETSVFLTSSESKLAETDKTEASSYHKQQPFRPYTTNSLPTIAKDQLLFHM